MAKGLEGLARYERVPVITRLIQGKDENAAIAAFDALYEGLGQDEDSQALYESLRGTKGGIAKALPYFLDKYKKAHESASVGEHWGLYKDGTLNGGELSGYGPLVKPFSDLHLQELGEELKSKQKMYEDVLDGKVEMGEEEVSRLKSDIDRYSNALYLIQHVGQLKISALELQAHNSARKTEENDNKSGIRAAMLHKTE